MRNHETMIESIIQLGEDSVFLRHNCIKPKCKTLLFVHGLGESGACFREVFQDRRFYEFNLMVPDLVGYGESSRSHSGGCNFDSHVKRLWQLLEKYETHDLIVIGHSMGGDITTLMCASDSRGIIKKYINIEGDVTQFDLFISSEAVKAGEKGNFPAWFREDFMIATVRDNWGKQFESCRRYYESLKQCYPGAFLANARELVKRNNNNAMPGEYKSETGQVYAGLSLPRVYCYGARSISEGTLRFLKENRLEVVSFEDSGHWVMIDKAGEFYSFLHDYVKT
ncbi:MAG TPA: alpha/beta hydrolase [Candidatus Deferrimicrobium sp.]|nr:alpha/beta hydrolase [Candidatus Deferrimicrobium sp.]